MVVQGRQRRRPSATDADHPRPPPPRAVATSVATFARLTKITQPETPSSEPEPTPGLEPGTCRLQVGCAAFAPRRRMEPPRLRSNDQLTARPPPGGGALRRRGAAGTRRGRDAARQGRGRDPPNRGISLAPGSADNRLVGTRPVARTVAPAVASRLNMARRFPEDPDFPPGRAAEAVVFETLADNLPDEAAVFWSIPFTDDHGETEADVIVAWPAVGRRGPDPAIRPASSTPAPSTESSCPTWRPWRIRPAGRASTSSAGTLRKACRAGRHG